MRFLAIFIFSLIVSPLVVSAKEGVNGCSKNGYTVATINGMFTDEQQAQDNKEVLKQTLTKKYKGENIDYQFLLNPSHIAGLGDVFAVAYQKLFDTETVNDYDLREIWNDSSAKVTTQKLLLVAHSQGNFYANSFYDSVAGKDGGVPVKSIGVYGVASPASRVAGNGKYLTSSTDKLINNLRWRNVLYIMPSNVDIKLPEGDIGNGHSFSDVYLKYEGAKIVADIQEALLKLLGNTTQNPGKPCIDPPKLSVAHKILKEVFAVADPLAVKTKDGAKTVNVFVNKSLVTIGNQVIKLANGLFTTVSSFAKSLNQTVGNLGKKNSAAVILAQDADSEGNQNISIESLDPPKGENLDPPSTNQSLENDGNGALTSPSGETEGAKNKSVRHGGDDAGGGGTSSSEPELAEEPAGPLEEEVPETPAPEATLPADTTPPVATIVGDNPENNVAAAREPEPEEPEPEVKEPEEEAPPEEETETSDFFYDSRAEFPFEAGESAKSGGNQGALWERTTGGALEAGKIKYINAVMVTKTGSGWNNGSFRLQCWVNQGEGYFTKSTSEFFTTTDYLTESDTFNFAPYGSDIWQYGDVNISNPFGDDCVFEAGDGVRITVTNSILYIGDSDKSELPKHRMALRKK